MSLGREYISFFLYPKVTLKIFIFYKKNTKQCWKIDFWLTRTEFRLNLYFHFYSIILQIYRYPNMLNRMSYIWHIYTCSFHYGKKIFPLLSSGKFPEMPYLWLIWLIYPILYWYSADGPWLICLSKHRIRKFRQASHCVLLTMRSFVLLVFFFFSSWVVHVLKWIQHSFLQEKYVCFHQINFQSL